MYGNKYINGEMNNIIKNNLCLSKFILDFFIKSISFWKIHLILINLTNTINIFYGKIIIKSISY